MVDDAGVLSSQRNGPSDDILGFEKAKYLLLVGSGCLIIVFIFGVILCRLDISAGKKRRAGGFQAVNT